jgi:predicted deacylase
VTARTASLATYRAHAEPLATKQRLWLRAGESAGDVALPAFVLQGAEPGPTMLVTAGMHGDEHEARCGLRLLFDRLDPASLRGTLIAVTTCNPWAFAAGSRCTPSERDGRNLAREFPGDPGGSPTQRLAHGLADLVDRHLGPQDLLVDLHSGGIHYAYRTLAGFRDHPGPAREASLEAARHAGLDCLWAIDPVEGTLTQFAAERGVPAVGTEFRGQGTARPQDVAPCVRALTGLLAHQGLVDASGLIRDSRPPRRTSTVHAGATAFVTDLPELGAHVARGDRIARTLDGLEAEIDTTRSPVAGEVWAVRTSPSIHKGDILALISQEPTA